MNWNIQGGMAFSIENESDNIVAAIQSSGIIQHYECTLLCCDNPVCTCGTVHMSFYPRGHADRNQTKSSYQVDYD